MNYKSIKDLPLKVFFEISETGDITLLGDDPQDVLIDRWEQIIIDYGKHDDNQSISNVIEKSDQLYNQAALYCEIKGMLLYLIGADKQEYVDRLNELGYKIDDSNHTSKIKSIQQNDRRANNISTRMQLIQKDIDKYQDGKKATFVSVMAWISSNLGFEPSDGIVVLKYLEYKKLIIEKQKAKRKK